VGVAMLRTATSPGLKPRADGTLKLRVPTGTYSSVTACLVSSFSVTPDAPPICTSVDWPLPNPPPGPSPRPAPGEAAETPAGPCADEHGVGVPHALAAQHHAAGLNAKRGRDPVVPGPQEHGTTEPALVEWQR
jgi:hypothetical protein